MTARKVVDGGEALIQTLYSAVALLVLLAACVDLCDAATAVDVYRLIQYDLSGAPFGSRRAALNHHAGVPPFPPAADLSRTAVVLTARHLDLDFLRDCVVNKRQLGGLLILLPRDLGGREAGESGDGDGSSPTAVLRGFLSEVEQLLLHSNLPYPVYFAFEDDKIDSILDEVKNNDSSGQPATATTGGYKFIVPTPDPKKIASPALTNIQGWLPGLRVDGDASQLPTIAIVASYDTFGAAPALAEGSDSNGSGVAALLEIARLFYRLYSDPKTRGSYNLLFGLTSGGPYNYNGTLKWLRGFDQRLRESIDYAICLNSVGSWDDELWLHVSKPPENAYIKHMHESMSDVAEELGAKIGIKHKKINISDSRVAWEHEQFSRLRITAATLSELSSAPELLEHTGGLSDSRLFVNEMGVARVVKLVAESLARHIYRQKGKKVEIFADDSSLGVSPSYIRLWLDLLSRTPRVSPFLPKNDQLILALKKELSDHTVDVNVQHEVLDGIFTFYDVTKGKLSIYQVASVTFDLLLLLALGSYLILLFSFLVITTRGLDDLISIFRRPPSRKVKTA